MSRGTVKSRDAPMLSIAAILMMLVLWMPSIANASPGPILLSPMAKITVDDTVHVKVYNVGYNEPTNDISSGLVTDYPFDAQGYYPNGTKVKYPVDMKLNVTWDRIEGKDLADFTDFVNKSAQTKSVQGRLNISRLVTMRDQYSRLDCFDELYGYEIKRDDLTSYFENKTPNYDPFTSIEIFLMNLSYFREKPGSPDHWIDSPIRDADTGNLIEWFRLEWDNDKNIPLAFPTESTAKGRRLFLDPSAYVWYLDWTYVWWQNGNSQAPYGKRYQDIPVGQRAAYLSGTLNEYLKDFLATWPDAPLHEKAQIATFLLDDSQRYSASQLEWTINQTKVMQYFNRWIPYLQWSDTYYAGNVSDFPGFEKALRENTTVVNGYKRIDGNKVHQYITTHKKEFVDVKPDTMTLITVCIYFENGSMYSQGKEFTGLGGGGVSSIYMNTSRLFYPNTQDKKMGISWVITHETGHNLGFPHPQYRPDLAENIMGYFHDPLELSVWCEDVFHKVRIRMLAEEINPLLAGVNDPNIDTMISIFNRDYWHFWYIEAYNDLLAIKSLLKGNYTIYGYVQDKTIVVPGINVTVQDRSSGIQIKVKTNSRGFYFVDLGAIGNGVKPGDTLRATATKGGYTALNEAKADTTMGTMINLEEWYTLPMKIIYLSLTSGDRSVKLDWMQADGNGLPILNNTIYRGDSQTNLTKLLTIPATIGYTDSVPFNDETYYYSVSASNALGEGERSDVKAIYLPPTEMDRPSQPKDLIAMTGSDYVVLTWKTPDQSGDSPIAKYIIYRYISQGSPVKIGETSALTYNDTNLSPRIYTYFVQALNQKGRAGVNSSAVSAEVKEPNNPIPPDQNKTELSQLVLVAIVVAVLALIITCLMLMGRRKRREPEEKEEKTEVPPLPDEG